MYDDFTMQLLQEENAPDPEGNILRGNRIRALINERRLDEAASMIPSITIPHMAEDLKHSIEFAKTCWCIQE